MYQKSLDPRFDINLLTSYRDYNGINGIQLLLPHFCFTRVPVLQANLTTLIMLVIKRLSFD